LLAGVVDYKKAGLQFLHLPTKESDVLPSLSQTSQSLKTSPTASGTIGAADDTA
jgi:hypothetical protein